jgi:hypothetical protein
VELHEANKAASLPAAISSASQQLAVQKQNACYLDLDAAKLNSLDLGLQSAIAKMTSGISPIGLSLAFQDWLMHLALSPGKQSELISLLNRHSIEWGPVLAQAASAEYQPSDVAGDAHFADNGWLDFVLASGGHHADFVSESGHARRSYKVMPHQSANAAYVSPDEWLEAASNVEGSWWPHWQQWLVAHSDAKRGKALTMGAGVTLADAPGLYVLGA